MTSLISKNIRFLRKKNRMSQSELGKKVNRSESTVQMWETDLRSPTMNMVRKLADIFNTDINNLVYVDLEEKNTVKIKMPNSTPMIRINIYGSLSCGNGMFVDENIIDTTTLPADMFKNARKDFFGQYAVGDSMVDAGINDGDLLIFENTNQIERGQIGCFCIDDNIATCKKYTVSDDNIIYLMPANSNYAPIRIDITNESFRIVGKLVIVIHKHI